MKVRFFGNNGRKNLVSTNNNTHKKKEDLKKKNWEPEGRAKATRYTNEKDG